MKALLRACLKRGVLLKTSRMWRIETRRRRASSALSLGGATKSLRILEVFNNTPLFKHALSILVFVFASSASAGLVKTVTVVDGENFKFVVTNYADCNGSGFEGVDLKMVSQKNKVKVYQVTPVYGPVTVIGCMKKGKNVQEETKVYGSKSDETVIFLLTDNLELVLVK